VDEASAATRSHYCSHPPDRIFPIIVRMFRSGVRGPSQLSSTPRAMHGRWAFLCKGTPPRRPWSRASIKVGSAAELLRYVAAQDGTHHGICRSRFLGCRRRLAIRRNSRFRRRSDSTTCASSCAKSKRSLARPMTRSARSPNYARRLEGRHAERGRRVGTEGGEAVRAHAGSCCRMRDDRQLFRRAD
jgi:hypothetical protein